MANENKICKYCWDNNTENEQPLIYPCQCSTGIHADCLVIWSMVRQDENRYQCEICKTNYIGIDIPSLSPPPSPRPVLEISNEQEQEQIEHQSIPEFLCCHCYKVEGGFYIAGIVFFFSSGVLGTSRPTKQDEQSYYTALVLIAMISCFFIAMGLTLTTKRYFKRLQEIRMINVVNADE